MRLSNVRPLSGTDSTLMRHTHKLRMSVFRTAKDSLLCAKRRRIEPQYVTFCNLNRKRPNINELRITQEKRGKRVAPMAQTGRRTAATRPHEGFIRKLGVKVFTERGRRRRPTLLNRMWSEAQLAVSNAYKHRPRRGRTACWVVWYYGYAVIRYAPKPCTSTTKKSYNRKCHSPSSRTAYSVTAYRKFRSRWSLHMRLSNIGPLRGPMYVIVFTPKLRMNHA